MRHTQRKKINILHLTTAANQHEYFPMKLSHISGQGTLKLRKSKHTIIAQRIRFIFLQSKAPYNNHLYEHLHLYFNLSLLVLCGTQVEPFDNALVDGTEVFPMSTLSLLQLGHKSTKLLFPLVTKLHDRIQVLCVLQK